MSTVEIETIYGTSLDLDIPALKCKEGAEPGEDEVDCLQTAEYPDNNKYHVNIINAFIDFFVQYHNNNVDDTADDDGKKIGKYLQNVLQLKKIMYSFTIEHKDKYRSVIGSIKEKNYDDKIKSSFDMVSNMGRGNMEVHVQQHLGPIQKRVNLYLLFLSYNVLSFSGILGIDIIEMDVIIEEEKKKGEQSFILQFLPKDIEHSCFLTIQLLFNRNEIDTLIIRKINQVADAHDAGGSKRFQKYHTRIRKHKSRKHKSRKHKSRKHKSRKSNKNAKKKDVLGKWIT